MPCKNHPSIEGPLWQCSRCGQPFCMDCIVQIGGHSYCAECKAEAMRDLRAGVPVQQLEQASIGLRFVALFLDSVIVGIPLGLLIVGVVAAMIFGNGMGEGKAPEDVIAGLMVGAQVVLSIVVVGIWIVYEGELLARSGQTLGKKIMKIKVVTPEGNAITRGQAYGRAGMRQLLGAVPCVGLVNYLVAFGQDRTCIHDMAAKTRVVMWNG